MLRYDQHSGTKWLPNYTAAVSECYRYTSLEAGELMTIYEHNVQKYLSQNPYARSVDALYRMRMMVFEYPEEKQAQAARVLKYLVERARRARQIERAIKRQTQEAQRAREQAERRRQEREWNRKNKKPSSRKRAREGWLSRWLGIARKR